MEKKRKYEGIKDFLHKKEIEFSLTIAGMLGNAQELGTSMIQVPNIQRLLLLYSINFA
ncbi:MAG: hypothetical protein RR581_07220 [Eubacterium sp.]